MSRIGKQPVDFSGVNMKFDGAEFIFSNGNTNVNYKLSQFVLAKIDGDKIFLSTNDPSGSTAFVGLDRSKVNNIVLGLKTPFSKVVDLIGVGYKSKVESSSLILSLGYSHEVTFPIPNGVKVEVNKNLVTFSSHDKEILGDCVAKVKKLRKLDVYKGKGVIEVGQFVRRKEKKKK